MGQTAREPTTSDGTESATTQTVADFLARVERLTDDDRVAVAEARRAVSEDYHESSLRAAAELLVGRGEEYARARVRVARAHLPDALDGAEDRERWQEVSRLVQLAVDEGLVALLVCDLLHPNHVRELYRSWWPLAEGREVPGQAAASTRSTSSA